jgi:hypothetical protein
MAAEIAGRDRSAFTISWSFPVETANALAVEAWL